MLAKAISRTDIGRSRKVQIIVASATVGRPMRRELTRVLGLTSSECPQIIRPKEAEFAVDNNLRAITIPSTVRNYYSEVGGNEVTAGSLLVHASSVIKKLPNHQQRKILLVLTRNCGMNIANTLGALNHFNGKDAFHT